MGNTANRAMDPAYIAEYGRVLTFVDTGDIRHAIVLLEDLCVRYPTDARVRSQLSAQRIRCKDYHGALRAAVEAISCDSEYPNGHINAGVAARMLGDLTTARGHLERAVAIAPDDPDAQLHLGMVLARLGDATAAIAAFICMIGEAHRVPHATEWLIEQGAAGLATVELSSPTEEPLQFLREGARRLATGQLARAYRLLECVRDGPCDTDAVAVHTAANVLLGAIWRKRARMTPVTDDPERELAPLITLSPPR